MRPLIALAAVAAAVTVLGAAAGCSSSKSGDHTPTSAPPVTSTAAATSTATSTATATSTLGDAERVAQWYAGVQAHFASIQSDTEAIKVAAQNTKVAALPGLCGELRVNVATANSDPVPPNKLLASAVTSALAAYGGAATSCLAGDYNAAATSINKGAAFLAQANSIMSNLS
jgi:hypothetical protein